MLWRPMYICVETWLLKINTFVSRPKKASPSLNFLKNQINLFIRPAYNFKNLVVLIQGISTIQLAIANKEVRILIVRLVNETQQKVLTQCTKGI